MSGAARVFAIVTALRRRLLGPRGVDLAGVVAAALFRVRQQVVRRRNLLELLLGALVARIEVRMQLLGELPVGLADFLRRRGLGDAEDFIGVFQTRLRSGSIAPMLTRLPAAVSRLGWRVGSSRGEARTKKPPRRARRLPFGSKRRLRVPAGPSAVGRSGTREIGQATLRLPALDLPVRLSATMSKFTF